MSLKLFPLPFLSSISLVSLFSFLRHEGHRRPLQTIVPPHAPGHAASTMPRILVPLLLALAGRPIYQTIRKFIPAEA